jgi:D-apionolactonase
VIKLKAGQIELCYENGFLRQFIVNETEVLRMIYFAIRDANWGNYEPKISNEKITFEEDSFQITYSVEYYDNTDIFLT